MINKIWCGSIARDYKAGQITTERCLQAALYCAIRSELKEIEVYVEPGLMYYDKGSPRYRPDIVLCNSEQILLIGEIKFMPHWYPEFKPDIKKFAAYAGDGRSKKHELRIDPKTGCYTEDLHQITGTTQYAFFVVGRSDSEAVCSESIRSVIDTDKLNKRVSLYFGTTHPERDPEFGFENEL